MSSPALVQYKNEIAKKDSRLKALSKRVRESNSMAGGLASMPGTLAGGAGVGLMQATMPQGIMGAPPDIATALVLQGVALGTGSRMAQDAANGAASCAVARLTFETVTKYRAKGGE